MNGEDCWVLLERSSRPLRPTRPAARPVAIALARSLARQGSGPTASRGEPVRRHDEWSAHYGEVPATKSRDEMSPFACERAAPTRSAGGGRGARPNRPPARPNSPAIGGGPPIAGSRDSHWVVCQLSDRSIGVALRRSPPRRWRASRTSRNASTYREGNPGSLRETTSHSSVPVSHGHRTLGRPTFLLSLFSLHRLPQPSPSFAFTPSSGFVLGKISPAAHAPCFSAGDRLSSAERQPNPDHLIARFCSARRPPFRRLKSACSERAPCCPRDASVSLGGVAKIRALFRVTLIHNLWTICIPAVSLDFGGHCLMNSRGLLQKLNYVRANMGFQSSELTMIILIYFSFISGT